MHTATRFDAVPITKASLTPEGYLVDTPILGRTGVQVYRRADGRTVREYRPPAAVFDPAHLASIRGKPIVNGHPGRVNADNVRTHAIGTILTEGRQEGNHLRADIVIHDPSAVLRGGKRELSLGYVVSIRDEAGTTPEGERYDAIQERIISCDHLAVVAQGRAGVARLNLDGDDAAELVEDEGSEGRDPAPPPPAPPPPSPPPPPPPQEPPIVTESNVPQGAPAAARLVLVRVDGIEYQAPPEVVRDLDRLRQDMKDAASRADKAEAERDTLAAAAAKFEAEKAQIRLDAAAAARSRVKLEIEAGKHGVEVRSDMTDRALRESVIRKIRGGEQNFEGRSDDYLSAAYDLAVADAGKFADQNARNRATVQAPVPGARADAAMAPHSGHPAIVSASAARERMIRNSLTAR